MIVKTRYKYTPTCDGCGATLEPEYEFLDAAAATKRAGWSFVKPNCAGGEWYNFCPECAAKRRVNDG